MNAKYQLDESNDQRAEQQELFPSDKHRHHLPSREGKKEIDASRDREATATVVVFLRVSPSREIPFFILRRVSGFVKEKRKNGEGTRATGGRPYKSGVFGETGWCRLPCGRRVVAPTIGKAGVLRSVSHRPAFHTAER